MLAGDPAAMLAPALRAGYAQLRQLPLFDGVPNDSWSARLASGDLVLRGVERDAIVADAADAPPAPRRR
jgi:hypothetical protein